MRLRGGSPRAETRLRPVGNGQASRDHDACHHAQPGPPGRQLDLRRPRGDRDGQEAGPRIAGRTHPFRGESASGSTTSRSPPWSSIPRRRWGSAHRSRCGNRRCGSRRRWAGNQCRKPPATTRRRSTVKERSRDIAEPRGSRDARGSSRRGRTWNEPLQACHGHSVFEGIDTSTPVLVLTASPRARRAPHSTLGILRSLGRLGVPVHTVDSNPRGPSSYSRYLRRRFIFDLASASPEATVEHLLRAGRRLGSRAVLIPTWDDISILVAEAYPALREQFMLPHQPEGLSRLSPARRRCTGWPSSTACPPRRQVSRRASTTSARSSQRDVPGDGQGNLRQSTPRACRPDPLHRRAARRTRPALP